MNNIMAPKGTRDLFPPEISKWQMLERKIRAYFSRFLFQEIRTPVFEYTELFQKGTGSETEVVQKEMYTFKDKGNRSITLRPENTPSVVRATLEHNLLNDIYPIRFFYIGPMFRYDKPQKGRYRQFHQFGVEIFGDPSPEVDAELIFAAFGFLAELGINQVDILINSVGCPSCRPPFLRQLQDAARLKERELCPDCQRKTATNPLRIFDCKNPVCQKISESFPRITDFLCRDCADHFQNVQQTLATLETPFRVNSRLVRGLDYYTRTVFEITSDQLGAQDALLGGGRYDNLFQELGSRDIPCTGFAAGMERIILHLENGENRREKVIFIVYQDQTIQPEAIKLAKYLWGKGIPTHLEYNAQNMKKQFKKASRLGAGFTFILGEEELNHRTISIKNMETTEQIQIKREELDQWLKENR